MVDPSRSPSPNKVATVGQPSQDPESAPEVQLAWELFTNCTEKQAPAHFLNLMTAAGVLIEVLREIEAETATVLSE